MLSNIIKRNYYKQIILVSLKYKDQDLTTDLKSWIYYLSLSNSIQGLEIYLMNNCPDTYLEYLLERHEKDSLRANNIPIDYLLLDKQDLYVIKYNNQILEEISKWEKTLTIREIYFVITEVLNLNLSSYELMKLAHLNL